MGQGNNFAQLTDGNGIDFSTRIPLARKYKVEVMQLSLSLDLQVHCMGAHSGIVVV